MFNQNLQLWPQGSVWAIDEMNDNDIDVRDPSPARAICLALVEAAKEAT